MRTFVLLLLTLYFAPIYSVNMGNDSDIFMNRLSVNQEFQGNFSYKYGMRKITKNYIYTIQELMFNPMLQVRIGMNINVRNLEMRMKGIWTH